MSRNRVKAMWNTDVTVEYSGTPGFGLFLDIIEADTSRSIGLAELSPKRARKLAKAILKATKKGKR